MDHGLELIIARLEILGIEVCNILQNPGNIGNLIFLIQSYPGNIGKRIFPISPYPGNTANMFFFYIFGFFPKKTRAKISRRMVRFSRQDLSYETDSGLKTKTVSDPDFQVKYIFMQPPGCMKTCLAFFFMQPPGCMKICLVFSLTA